MRCVSRNLNLTIHTQWDFLSHLAWGVWVEILWLLKMMILSLVAPRMRCVSRNSIIPSPRGTRWVAPRMRCVSRNPRPTRRTATVQVAPRMRCVSRNLKTIIPLQIIDDLEGDNCFYNFSPVWIFGRKLGVSSVNFWWFSREKPHEYWVLFIQALHCREHFKNLRWCLYCPL